MGMNVHAPFPPEYVPGSQLLHVLAPAVCSECWRARTNTSVYARQSATCTAVMHVKTEEEAEAEEEEEDDDGGERREGG